MSTSDSTHLSGFLTYATASLPDLAKSIKDTLAADFRKQGIEHPRLQQVLRNPRNLIGIEPVLTGCNCQDLIEQVAQLLIREADSAKWLDSKINLNVVSMVLRSGRKADAPDTHRFLQKIVTPAWLEKNYDTLPPRYIALALRALWAWTPDLIGAFRAEALNRRASGLIWSLHHKTDEQAIQCIELLGACRLFHVDATKTVHRWPSQPQLNRFLQFFADNLGEHLRSHQIRFLIGLRELSRRRPDSISIPENIGSQVLARWQTTVSENPNHEMLKAWMVEWLEKCAKANWQLVKDNIPLPQPVSGSSSSSGPQAEALQS